MEGGVLAMPCMHMYTEFYLYAALEALVPAAKDRKLDRSARPARERAVRAAIDAIVAAGPEGALEVLVRLTAESAYRDARGLARALVDGWAETGARCLARRARPPRTVMLEVLAAIDDVPLLAKLIDRVIVPSYDGNETAELAAALVQLDPKQATPLCSALFAAKALVQRRCRWVCPGGRQSLQGGLEASRYWEAESLRWGQEVSSRRGWMRGPGGVLAVAGTVDVDSGSRSTVHDLHHVTHGKHSIEALRQGARLRSRLVHP